MATKIKGIHVYQKAKGGTWYLRWFDPREDRKEKRSSTETTDYEQAIKIAEDLYDLIHDSAQWEAPKTSQPRTAIIWGAEPLSDIVLRNIVKRDLTPLPLPEEGSPYMKYVKTFNENRKKLSAEEKRFHDFVKDAINNSIRTWKERALAAEEQLAKLGAKSAKRIKELEKITLREARTAWVATLLRLDHDYKRDLEGISERFIQKFGETTKLSDVLGMEKEIDDWIAKMTHGKKRDNKIVQVPISPTRIRMTRIGVLKFLTHAGVSMDRKAIRRPKKDEVRTARQPIYWVSRDEAIQVMEKLKTQHYDPRSVFTRWHEVWKVQVTLGLRAEEIPTLKRPDFDQNFKLLKLSVLNETTLKEGTRNIEIPEPMREFFKDAFKDRTILFTKQIRKKKGEKETKEAPIDDMGWYCNAYKTAIRKAAKAAGIHTPMDARVGRRTCATLMIAAGKPIAYVAKILGDSVETIMEHYGGVVPGSLNPMDAYI